MEIQLREMLHRAKAVNKITMKKSIKIIAIISFLLTCSIDEKGLPIMVTLLIYSFVSIQEIVYYGHLHNILWEGLIYLPLVIGTIIVFFNTKKYKERYLQVFCFISLLMTSIPLTGCLDIDRYNHIKLDFIIPLSVFIISSLVLIILTFRDQK